MAHIGKIIYWVICLMPAQLSSFNEVNALVSSQVLPTAIVSNSEVATVRPLRRQAKEKLVSPWWIISIDSTHRLDPLSEKPASINMDIPVELN